MIGEQLALGSTALVGYILWVILTCSESSAEHLSFFDVISNKVANKVLKMPWVYEKYIYIYILVEGSHVAQFYHKLLG